MSAHGLLIVVWMVCGFSGGWLAADGLSDRDWPRFAFGAVLAALGISAGLVVLR